MCWLWGITRRGIPPTRLHQSLWVDTIGRIDEVSVERRGNVVIEAVMGDITRQTVDAVVNAANQYLIAGGGVDGAIHEAAGEHELSAACAEIGGCEVGDAKATPGFALIPDHIIHTVGPIWSGGQNGEAEQLASCYRRCLEVADELDAASIAFPAISTGAFGFPPDLAATIAVSTLRNTPTDVRLARLVAFDGETLALYQRCLDAAE